MDQVANVEYNVVVKTVNRVVRNNNSFYLLWFSTFFIKINITFARSDLILVDFETFPIFVELRIVSFLRCNFANCKFSTSGWESRRPRPTSSQNSTRWKGVIHAEGGCWLRSSARCGHKMLPREVRKGRSPDRQKIASI